MIEIREGTPSTRWFVLTLFLVGCQADPVPTPTPSAVSPEPVTEESADLGSASFPSLEKTEDPRPATDAGTDCDALSKATASLASKCFRLIPDDEACAEFFPLITELREAGCVIPDAGLVGADASPD